jgi:hypothetical protein
MPFNKETSSAAREVVVTERRLGHWRLEPKFSRLEEVEGENFEDGHATGSWTMRE